MKILASIWLLTVLSSSLYGIVYLLLNDEGFRFAMLITTVIIVLVASVMISFNIINGGGI